MKSDSDGQKQLRKRPLLSSYIASEVAIPSLSTSLALLAMIELSNNLILLVLALAPLAALSTFRRIRRNSSGLPYPPGPPPRLIVGNLFDLPKARTHLVLAEWSKRYNSTLIHRHRYYSPDPSPSYSRRYRVVSRSGRAYHCHQRC